MIELVLYCSQLEPLDCFACKMNKGSPFRVNSKKIVSRLFHNCRGSLLSKAERPKMLMGILIQQQLVLFWLWLTLPPSKKSAVCQSCEDVWHSSCHQVFAVEFHNVWPRQILYVFHFGHPEQLLLKPRQCIYGVCWQQPAGTCVAYRNGNLSMLASSPYSN